MWFGVGLRRQLVLVQETLFAFADRACRELCMATFSRCVWGMFSFLHPT
jgi:hypothetical protein